MLSLGQTPLLALPHHSCSDFPHRLHSVCPNLFGEATGFCLPRLVYWFPLASACFLLVSLCCSWPLTWVTLGRSPSGCPCPSVGSSEVSLSMAGSASSQESPSLQLPPPQHLQPHVSKSITSPWRLLLAFLSMSEPGHHVLLRWAEVLAGKGVFSHVSETAGLGTRLFMASFHTGHPLLPNPCHLCPMHRVPLQAVLSPL